MECIKGGMLKHRTENLAVHMGPKRKNRYFLLYFLYLQIHPHLNQRFRMGSFFAYYDKYVDDASGYANRLIYSIPIPKGKSIAVRKALAKNGGKK